MQTVTSLDVRNAQASVPADKDRVLEKAWMRSAGYSDAKLKIHELATSLIGEKWWKSWELSYK